jgi:hypothetical protein
LGILTWPGWLVQQPAARLFPEGLRVATLPAEAPRPARQQDPSQHGDAVEKKGRLGRERVLGAIEAQGALIRAKERSYVDEEIGLPRMIVTQPDATCARARDLGGEGAAAFWDPRPPLVSITLSIVARSDSCKSSAPPAKHSMSSGWGAKN